MQHEVRSIPPAPRRVRTKALLAHRWPLLAIGGTLTVVGSLLAWLMFLQSGGKYGGRALLERGPTARLSARIDRVRAPVEIDGRTWRQVRYQFEFNGAQLLGDCFVPDGPVAVGDQVQIDVSVADPNTSCVVGGLVHNDWLWLQARFWIVVSTVPGGLLLLGWLAGVFQLRRVLVHGDVSVARILSIDPVRFVLPEMYSVSYEFRDHRARLQRNRHWVRTHGDLGLRLHRQLRAKRLESMPVLHDRRLPQWNRLLVPQDFLPVLPGRPQPVNDLP